MSSAEWRALISAYADGRIGADAFKRRFLEAFAVAVERRQPVPAPVQDLYFVVDAYAGDPMGRGADVTDDADLMRAARAALGILGAREDVRRAAPSEPIILVASATGEGARQARRFVWRLGTIGGLGCAIGLLWVALGIAQFFAIAAQIDSVLRLGPAPSTLLALPLAFTPGLGALIAFFGAKDVWLWPWPLAALLFLLVPALLAFGGWRAIRRP